MKNWSGNVTYTADHVAQPTSMSELAAALTGTGKVRALGSRHSFTNIADAATVIDTTALPEFLEISADRTSVTVNGSMTYGRLIELLAPFGFALHNLASLPHISVAGAIATGTHGSGDRNGNLATAVSGLQIMTPTGEVFAPSRGDHDFAGAVVSLGLLGVVTGVTLDIEPAFTVEQWVYDGPDLHELAANFDDVFSSAYSVSTFTHFQGRADQIWVKHRTDHEAKPLNYVAASEKRHPIMSEDAQACTDQFGVAGPWSQRLPHFKLDFTPSVGEEIQSEFFVGRNDAVEAIAAVNSIGDDLSDAMMVSELRTIAADELWMSPHYQRDTLAFHFTWFPDQAKAEDAAHRVADALADFAPRTHWGKVYDPAQFSAADYDRCDDFLGLVERIDPQGRMQNTWFDTHFGR